MSSAPVRSHRLARQLSQVAVAVMMMTVSLLAQWHQATVLHARCAAHDELIHVGPASDHPVGDREVAQHTGRTGAEHEHCQLVASTTSSTTVSAPVITSAPIAIVVIVPSPTTIAQLARATYRLAPKTSPPLA